MLLAGIKMAMIDLHWVWMMFSAMAAGAMGVAKEKLLGVANVICVGLCFANSYSGRPGEWSRLMRETVETMMKLLADLTRDGNVAYLIMTKHKTLKKHGVAGRPVPAGNVVALGKLLEMHPAESDRMFVPQK